MMPPVLATQNNCFILSSNPHFGKYQKHPPTGLTCKASSLKKEFEVITYSTERQEEILVKSVYFFNKKLLERSLNRKTNAC